VGTVTGVIWAGAGSCRRHWNTDLVHGPQVSCWACRMGSTFILLVTVTGREAPPSWRRTRFTGTWVLCIAAK
jgi:hypothetical protein